jgi:hypothetical protein
VKLRETLRKIKGQKLLISKEKVRSCYYINSDKPYDKLLEEIQVRLIKLDVLEIEKQMLTLVFDTKYANRLEADLMNLSKVIRFKMVKV